MLRIARAVSLIFRAAGASSCASLTRRPTLAIRVARALRTKRVATCRQAAAWRVGYCAADPAFSSVLIARAALLLVATHQRESRGDYQDHYFHI